MHWRCLLALGTLALAPSVAAAREGEALDSEDWAEVEAETPDASDTAAEWEALIQSKLVAPLRGPESIPLSWALGVQVRSLARGTDEVARAGGAVAAEGAIRIAYEYGVYSSVAETGAAIRAQSEPGLSGYALDHWAHVRPWEVGLFRFDVEHHLVVNGRPELARRPDLLRLGYTSEHFGVDLVGMHWRGRQWGFEFMHIIEGFELTWQHEQIDLHRRFSTTSDWVVFGLTQHHDRDHVGRIETLVLEAEAVDDARDAAVINLLAARIRDLRIGPLVLEGALGSGTTGSASGSFGDSNFDIDTEDLPTGFSWIGRAGMGLSMGDLQLFARAHRSLFLTFDVNLAREDRLATELSFALAGGTLSVQGFAAKTALWTTATAHTTQLTGGGAASYLRPLRGGWTVDLQGEAARSFFATLGGDATPLVANATRFEVGLRKDFGGRRRLQ